MRFGKVKLAVPLLMAVSLVACKEYVPASGTVDYNRLHGIINDGKTVNEITLVVDGKDTGPTVRFPKDMPVLVETAGTHDADPIPIRRGFANSARTTLFYAKDVGLVRINPVQRKADSYGVMVEFHASRGPQRAQDVEKRLQEIAQLSVRTTDRPELGLREYVLLVPKTDVVSQYVYVPIGEALISPDGGRMYIGCRANDNGPTRCADSFTYQGRLAVAYDYSPDLLSHWRQLHQDVVNFAISTLVTQ